MLHHKRKGLMAIVLLITVLGGFAALLWANAAPAEPLLPALPTQIPASGPADPFAVLRQSYGQNSTPLPTVAIPTQTFAVPTLAPQAAASATPVAAAQLNEQVSSGGAIAAAVTPSPPPATTTGQARSALVSAQSVTRQPSDWQPPPLEPPLSRDPQGRDHFWLRRPVDSNANNAVLFYYPFGSDGPEKNNPLRVHHGIDMPNDIGETVRAAGSGLVVWAADGRQAQSDIFQNSPSYGNVIVIEHDFGHEGQPIYTLYAHLSAALVESGQKVEAGEVIGLVGNSGRVSGPHIHFEVRIGENKYRAAHNPALWMVPYVGHGVVVGRIQDVSGVLLQDADITLRSRASGLVVDTTTSYVTPDTGFDVNADPVWQENFVIPDVPVGRYDVIATIDGERVLRQVDVMEGTSSFVELQPLDSVAAEPDMAVEPEPESSPAVTENSDNSS